MNSGEPGCQIDGSPRSEGVAQVPVPEVPVIPTPTRVR